MVTEPVKNSGEPLAAGCDPRRRISSGVPALPAPVRASKTFLASGMADTARGQPA